MLSTEENKQKLEMLIRTFFNRLHGYHVQYNIVSRETLIDAQKHPEKHKDLIFSVGSFATVLNTAVGPFLSALCAGLLPSANGSNAFLPSGVAMVPIPCPTFALIDDVPP